MNKAQTRLEQIRSVEPKTLLEALFIANSGSWTDENFSGERILTFTFTYDDESELKIDTEGHAYADNDFQYRIY